MIVWSLMKVHDYKSLAVFGGMNHFVNIIPSKDNDPFLTTL